MGTQETNFSLTDHFIDKHNFEKLAMLIMGGDIDRNAGALRQASRLFHRSILLNVGHELTGCVLDVELRVTCSAGAELHGVGQNVEMSPHFMKRERKLFRVRLFEQIRFDIILC